MPPSSASRPPGSIAGGREHGFDALVLATGFDAMTGNVVAL